MNIPDIKKDFPILENVAYLDNAAISLSPEPVIHAMNEFEHLYTANVDDKDRIGVVSFNIHGLHSHEVAHILDEAAAIMVRSGDHCCQPLMKHLGFEQGTVQASLYLYNTEEEIDLLIAAVEEIARRL